MKSRGRKCKYQRYVHVISTLLFHGCFIYLLFLENLFAQTPIIATDKNKILFKHNYVSVNFSLLKVAKANIQRKTGTYALSSSRVPGIKLGVLYQINYNTKVSLNTGLEAAILGDNFIFKIDKNKYSPALKENYSFNGKQTGNGRLVICLPLTLEKRFWYAYRNYVKAEAGIILNYSTAADVDLRAIYVEDINGNFIPVMLIDVNANNEAKPWISYVVNVAHSWRLKNNNFLQAGLRSNLSLTKYTRGTYSINIPNQSTTSGNYSSSGSYVALFLRYAFTSGNYHLRKLYEGIKK